MEDIYSTNEAASMRICVDCSGALLPNENTPGFSSNIGSETQLNISVRPSGVAAVC